MMENSVLLRDTFGRVIDYIRISITDRCNLRCIYCMPDGRALASLPDILSFEEILKFIEAASEVGIKKIRITGGEPLLRRGLPDFIKSIKAIGTINDISLTTNGQLLGKYAQSLAESGLNRVNVSLDTLNAQRYSDITRGGSLESVLNGIKKAEEFGLLPIKLNMVPLRGVNDDEIEDFARVAMTTDYQVRFIELMPVCITGESDDGGRLVSMETIMYRLNAMGTLVPLKLRKHGPARYYTFENSSGVIGIISGVTCQFCSDCNRLRFTSDGKLRPCLFSDIEVDFKTLIRNGASKETLKLLILNAAHLKPEKHDTKFNLKTLSRIGG
ncbi:GTP 3',8-cyclase MoaA [Candidatus Magnetomonas plexicatena]|uniref:GTP 3',8-cyclase MoaA n=1 Tax=Candidatus Magnetomonas plexicatena TaxID=2552947 RepID=UPI001C76932F|nr:GTP 3',8-cyclase MoaA [Nitrospirales bacterium LBB_01]